MKRILSTISLLAALAGTASAAPYVMPPNQYGALTPYDIQPAFGIEALYSIAQEDNTPDSYGVRGSFNMYDSGEGTFRHQFNLNVAALWGSDDIVYEDGFKEDVDLFLVPVTMGYNLNIALSDNVFLYLGAKAGYAWARTEYSSEEFSDGTDGNGFTYSVGGGLKIQCSSTTYVHVGYEFGRSYLDYNDGYEDDVYGAHTISLGISTTF